MPTSIKERLSKSVRQSEPSQSKDSFKTLHPDFNPERVSPFLPDRLMEAIVAQNSSREGTYWLQDSATPQNYSRGKAEEHFWVNSIEDCSPNRVVITSP